MIPIQKNTFFISLQSKQKKTKQTKFDTTFPLIRYFF